MTSYTIPKCLIIDAKDHIMGRLASTVAKHLQMGTKIYILRAERMVISGHMIRNKLKMRSFFRHRMTTKPTRGPYHYNAPSRFFYKVVRGMLPHRTPRGKKCMALLHVYDGMPPRFANMRKVKLITAYRHLRLDPNRPMSRLGALCSEFGWGHGKLIAKLEARRQIKTKKTYKIRKEIDALRLQARKNVAERMKSDYAFLTKYEHDLPTQA